MTGILPCGFDIESHKEKLRHCELAMVIADANKIAYASLRQNVDRRCMGCC